MEQSFRRLSFVHLWLLALLFVANDGLAQVILSGNQECPGSTLTVTSPHPIRQIEWFKNNVSFSTVQATWRGNTRAGGNGDGAALHQFDSALAMAIDATGHIYVSDLNNHRVLKFPPGSTQSTVGVIVAGGNGPGAALNQLHDPGGIFLDGAGNLYVADMGNHRVLRFPPGADETTDGLVVAGGAGLGQGFNQFNSPISIYIDAAGRLYVADRDNHRVLRYPDAHGTNKTGVIVAGNGMSGVNLNQLDQPVSITMYDHRLLVSEYRNHRVTSWDPENPNIGTVVAGNIAGWGNGPDRLHFPTGISVDSAGLLYIADSDNDRIVGWPLGPVPATTGIAQIDHGEGATDDQLNQPLAVYREGVNSFIVLDLINNRVQQFTRSIATTYTATEAGSYHVIVTHDDGTTETSGNVIIQTSHTPTVTITPGTPTICAGTTTSFIATATYEGSTPTYTWKLNGIDLPVVGPVYDPPTLLAGDEVSVVMHPSLDAGCLTVPAATSNLVQVALHPTPTMEPIAGANNICLNGSTTLSNTTAAPSHTWKSLAPTIVTIDAASGQVRGIGTGTALIKYYATSAAGCMDSTAATIRVDALITSSVDVRSTHTTSCKGKLVTFTASGTNTGATPDYTWLVNGVNAGVSGPTFSADTLTHQAMVQAILTPSADIACKASATVTSAPLTVTVYPLPVVAPITGNTFLCDNSATQLSNNTANATAVWKSLQETIATVDGTGKVQGIDAGQTPIRFIATSPDGCVDSVQTVVKVGQLPVMAPITGIAAICLHSNTQLATAGTGGVWTSLNPAVAKVDATGKVLGKAAGTSAIRFIATSADGCKDSVERTVTVNALYTPTLYVSASANAVCQGDPITFTAVAGPAGATPRFEWFVNNTSTGKPGISYTSSTLQKGDVVHVVMTPSADASCVSSPTINSMAIMVTVGLPPAMKPITGNAVLCSGTTSQLATATTGVSGAWRSLHTGVATVSSTGLVSGLTAGTAVIRYVGTTPIGCRDSVDLTVTVNTSVTPSITIDANHPDTCTGVAIRFSANAIQGGTQPGYQWQVNRTPAGTGARWSSTTLRQGDVVRCVLTSNATCAVPPSVNSNEIVLAVHALPVINAGPDKTILRGETVLLEGRVSDDVAAISWTPLAGLQQVNTATPVAGPATTTRYRLEAATAKGCSASDDVLVSVIESVKVPNAFSPNGDGIHDTWEIPDLGYVAQVEIQVFNRNGQPVYLASSYQRGKGWNGAYKGYVLPAGTYYYVIDLKNGKPKLSGAVTLLK